MAKRSKAKRRLVYTLHQDCLRNEGPPGNIWQIQGGRVMQKSNHVGHYSIVRRVSCGTSPQNVAQLWLTLFFLGEQPPQNITLHGAHDYSLPGDSNGSVSAASSLFKTQIGKQFRTRRTTPSVATVMTLTIG